MKNILSIQEIKENFSDIGYNMAYAIEMEADDHITITIKISQVPDEEPTTHVFHSSTVVLGTYDRLLKQINKLFQAYKADFNAQQAQNNQAGRAFYAEKT